MNIVALITFSSAAGLLLAVRLIGCASDFQGVAAARLPVIFTGPAATASSAATRCRIDVLPARTASRPTGTAAQISVSTRRTRDGDFYLATSEDLHLATHQSHFLMATDTRQYVGDLERHPASQPSPRPGCWQQCRSTMQSSIRAAQDKRAYLASPERTRRLLV